MSGKVPLRMRFHAVRVHNTHDLLRLFATLEDDFALIYNASGRSRVGGVRVYSTRRKTDPEAHWMDYGCKRFSGARKVALPPAQAWVAEQFRITEWKSVPLGSHCRGDMIPKSVYDRALAWLAAKERQIEHDATEFATLSTEQKPRSATASKANLRKKQSKP